MCHPAKRTVSNTDPPKYVGIGVPLPVDFKRKYHAPFIEKKKVFFNVFLCDFAPPTPVVHKEGFVLFIISSLIYMTITCRLWRSIKEYSLCYEVRKSAQTKI